MPRLLTASLLAGLLALGACNTMEGLGQDVENTGEALEEEASE
jgi:predicted small secreted protein